MRWGPNKPQAGAVRWVQVYLVIVALDDFQEECGPVLHGLGEDLQEVAFLIVVYQDVQLLGGRQWAPLKEDPLALVGSLDTVKVLQPPNRLLQ